MRTARLVTGRRKILTRRRSYHGASQAVLAASGDPRRWPVEGGMGDIVRIPDPYHYRFPWITDPAEFRDFNLAQIAEIIELEGPHTVAAVMVEPITGSNGLIVPPAGWLAGLRRAVRPLRHAADLRRGDERLRAHRALVRRRPRGRRARHHDDRQGDHQRLRAARRLHRERRGGRAHRRRPVRSGLTYNSHAVGLAAARANLAIYESDGLVERSAKMGDHLLAGLHELQERHPCVGDVRGDGLFSVMELVYDRDTRPSCSRSSVPPSRRPPSCARFLTEHGLLASIRGSFLFANPPLIVTIEQIDEALAVLRRGVGHRGRGDEQRRRARPAASRRPAVSPSGGPR